MQRFSAIIITILLLIQTMPLYANDEIKKTGTFSSLFYHQEAGDLLGFEVRIVYTRTGWEGTFQASEGSPEGLILLKKILIENTNVRFSIPGPSRFEGEFIGQMTKNELSGTLRLHNGNKISMQLKRGKSYWD